jgi:phage tail-like protein
VSIRTRLQLLARFMVASVVATGAPAVAADPTGSMTDNASRGPIAWTLTCGDVQGHFKAARGLNAADDVVAQKNADGVGFKHTAGERQKAPSITLEGGRVDAAFFKWAAMSMKSPEVRRDCAVEAVRGDKPFVRYALREAFVTKLQSEPTSATEATMQLTVTALEATITYMKY